MNELKSFFSDNGALAKILAGYQARAAQTEMAETIASAIEENQNLIAEAGTGTGKTFAYLVPAILSDKKVVISTGTKNLQDQLFNKDLPIVRKALKTPFVAALLKGRSNYLLWMSQDTTPDRLRRVQPFPQYRRFWYVVTRI